MNSYRLLSCFCVLLLALLFALATGCGSVSSGSNPTPTPTATPTPGNYTIAHAGSNSQPITDTYAHARTIECGNYGSRG
jgi:hypothetical protein